MSSADHTHDEAHPASVNQSAQLKASPASQDHYMGGAFGLLIAGLATAVLTWYQARKNR